MDGDKIVTHRDIAARVGCDKSTVSLALRGSPKIAAKMGQRIREAAKELGYRPDPAIATLARHRWARDKARYRSTIAYVVQKKGGDGQLQLRHFDAARRHAEERGYVLTEFDLSDYPSGASASRVLFNRGIRGIVLPAMEQEMAAEIHAMDWEKFTVVCCSLGSLRTPFHVIAPDVFEGTRRAWLEVAAKGYRRIGAALFQHAPVAVDDYARLGASYVMQQELVPEKDRIPFLLCPPLDEQGFLQWFDLHRPEVVICFVYPVYDWLKRHGVRIPEDVSLVCLNVQPGYPLSGISVQFEEVGRAAVDFLIAQLSDNKWGVPTSQQMLLLEPQWLNGKTLAEPGKAKGPARRKRGPGKRVKAK